MALRSDVSEKIRMLPCIEGHRDIDGAVEDELYRYRTSRPDLYEYLGHQRG